METVTLQFQTPQDFHAFRRKLSTGLAEFNISELQLTCECSQDDIALAIKNFGATVISKAS